MVDENAFTKQEPDNKEIGSPIYIKLSDLLEAMKHVEWSAKTFWNQSPMALDSVKRAFAQLETHISVKKTSEEKP